MTNPPWRGGCVPCSVDFLRSFRADGLNSICDQPIRSFRAAVVQDARASVGATARGVRPIGGRLPPTLAIFFLGRHKRCPHQTTASSRELGRKRNPTKTAAATCGK